MASRARSTLRTSLSHLVSNTLQAMPHDYTDVTEAYRAEVVNETGSLTVAPSLALLYSREDTADPARYPFTDRLYFSSTVPNHKGQVPGANTVFSKLVLHLLWGTTGSTDRSSCFHVFVASFLIDLWTRHHVHIHWFR